MNTRFPDADGTHRLGVKRPEPLIDALTKPAPNRFERRVIMRDRLKSIAGHLSDMLEVWEDQDPELLTADEWPFTGSMEDVLADVNASWDVLAQRLEYDQQDAARREQGLPPLAVIDQLDLDLQASWEMVATAALHRLTDFIAASSTPEARVGEFVAAVQDCEKCRNHDPRDRRDHGHLPADYFGGPIARTMGPLVTDSPTPVGWCVRDGQPFETTDEVHYPDGVKPTCEHAGDPPVDKTGQDWRDYIQRVRAIRHIPRP